MIYVLEGPAGAGKTYCLQQLYTKQIARVSTPKINRPRNFDSSKTTPPETLSMVNDTLKLLAAFELKRISNTPVMIDRLVLSNFVYNVLRSPTETWSISDFKAYLRKQLNMVHYLKVGFQSRFQGQENFLLWDSPVKFILYLPGLKRIIDQREKTPKHYPFSADKEHLMYSRLFDWCLKDAPDLFTICENYNQVEAVITK